MRESRQNLLGVYLFGSKSRGDDDELSDTDVLAVVRNKSGRVDPDEVIKNLPIDLRLSQPAISWYGFNRISKMFENGELFAWHLHKEARPIFEDRHILDELGTPSPYQNALEDISSFIEILDKVPEQLQLSPGNAVYELGLIYVCVRNIGMSASWALNSAPDFSRYSAYRLPSSVGVCPLPIDRYEVAMACRMAGQRGVAPPEVSAATVEKGHEALVKWCCNVKAAVEEELRSRA